MPREKLSAEVRDEIESLIGTEFKKGERIPPEDELCKRFRVSRATLREAIRELVSAHVLEVRRGVGTFVTHHPGLVEDPYGMRFMDQSVLIKDVFETSILVEPGIASLCAERITPEELQQLKDVEEQIASLSAQYDKDPSPELEEQLFYQDGQFHMLVARFTGNVVLYYFFRSYSHNIEENIEAANVRHALKSIREYHPLLLDDFERHDGKSASEHMLKHDQEINDSFDID
jgi:GntR family transcriptional repressor for pyruvate dehydrogenase complex